MKMRLGYGIGLIILAVASLPQATSAGFGDRRLPVANQFRPAHPRRLIVKYRPRVSACAHCLLAARLPFATVTGSDSLDRLNRELHVRGARALFFEQHGGAVGRTAGYFAKLDTTRGRFAPRTARARTSTAAPDLSNVFVLDLPRSTDVLRAAARYAADPDVEYAQPDYERRATFMPNDPFFASSGTWQQPYLDLWGLQMTQAAAAWDTARGTGTVVAVIDTGVDYNHPDLAANMWANPGEIANNGVDDDGNGFIDDVRGWDFVDNDNTPYDLHGHGTHVAGTVAAVGNNGKGVVGMAWGAQIMAVRGLDASGSGYDSDLAQAIIYAAENGADVLNNSWGGPAIGSALTDAVTTASNLGVVVVAAAGNSAGNVEFFQPASIPQAIAVGATDAFDHRAGFSNFGDSLSVAAPGVDILSLRGAASAPVGGQVVASQYLRLSGTSMATPHTAGLAAVLLSAQPNLTPDEVRWHLELNADQPGYPGYEGQLWNPYFGWGRINAQRVFDAPAAAAQLRSQPIDLHAFAGSFLADAASADLSFTTFDPVPWSVSGPPWLPPVQASGAGPAHLSFSVDATELSPGSSYGSAVISATGTVNGGGSIAASLQTHRDERVGGVIPVLSGFRASSEPPPAPPIVSDGLGALVFWIGADLAATRIDGGGNLSGPFVLDPGSLYKEFFSVAFDGRNFLVVWKETKETTHGNRYSAIKSVKAMRVTPMGQPLDVPMLLVSRKDRGSLGIYPIGVGFDGEAYTAFWTEFSYKTNLAKVYVRRIGPDGSLRSPARKIYPRKSTRVTKKGWFIEPQIACTGGKCLLVWDVRDGETSSYGSYIDKVYGVRLEDDHVVDSAPIRILNDSSLLTNVATNGTDYLVSADRWIVCPGPAICGEDAVGARVTADGVALDLDGIRLNNGPVQDAAFPRSGGLTFDGTNYIATFVGGGPYGGTQVLGARIAADGQVLDDEPEGLLLHVGSEKQPYQVFRSTIASTPTHSIVSWADTLLLDPNDPYSFSNPIYAQRVLAHAPAAFSAAAVGAIGARAVAERDVLAFSVTAPGLGAGATFTATNLPPGALFDPATNAFRWMPAANEAGVYPAVHFSATDGVQTVNEDVTITVSEASRSVGGIVRLGDGTPVAGVSLKLRGAGAAPRLELSDPSGRYHFDDLSPGTYTVRIALPSTRLYRAGARTLAIGTADVSTADLIVTAKSP